MTPRRICSASLGIFGPDRKNATRVADKYFDRRVSTRVQQRNLSAKEDSGFHLPPFNCKSA